MSDKPTPEVIYNRPGLSTLSRRIGSYSSIKRSLIQSLSDVQRPGLKPFTTRDPQDWTIAYLSAFAQVSDTLTFYQERISNESYLGTASETMSVEQIAALVNYQPAPAMAANVYLAFTMDDTLPFQGMYEIEPGIAVKSIPIKEELPQTFETTTSLRAKASWNKILPAQFFLQDLKTDSKSFFLSAASANARVGDPVVFFSDGVPVQHDAAPRNYVCFVTKIQATIDNALRVDISRSATGQVNTMPLVLPEPPSSVELTNGSVSYCFELLKKYRWQRHEIEKAQNHFGLSTEDLSTALAWEDQTVSPTSLKVSKLTVRARLFGHNALPAPFVLNSAGTAERAYPNPSTLSYVKTHLGTQNPESSSEHYLYLDRKYEDITQGDFVFIRGRTSSAIVEDWVEILEVDSQSVAGYGQSAEVTRLRVWKKPALKLTNLILRSVEIFTGTENMALAKRPIADPVGTGSTIETGDIQLICEGCLLDLTIGQTVILSGRRQDIPGPKVSEVLKISEISLHGAYTALTFDSAFKTPYLRNETSLNANIALASHGETVAEIIGSGDGTKSHQRFALKRRPLTYMSAKTASGRAPALEIRVNNVLWNRVETLATAKASDRVYTVTTIGAGESIIQFGNGREGARLPTGENNITATYRVGAGLGGLVQAEQITLLTRKPMGVQTVTNPLMPFGGSAAETKEQAKINAPIKSLTLGRIVSLSDYKNFARAFGGIAKAHASWGWSQENRVACITVAAEDGQPLPESDGILPLLRSQMSAVSAPGGSVVVKNFLPIHVTVLANVFIDANYLPNNGSTDQIFSDIRKKLARDFGFSQQDLGKPIRLANVAASIQSVPGIIAVDIDQLHRTDTAPSREEIVRAYRPLQGEMGLSRGVELLTLSPEHIQLRYAT